MIIKKGEEFAGDKKSSHSLLTNIEKRIVAAGVPHIPSWIETYHLTLTTILWSALIILFSWLARSDIRWLWGVSVMIACQYITDLFDGAVGRYRNTGLVRWGYFMDHFLDYVFLSSILIGYAMLFPQKYALSLFFTLMMFAGVMVLAYLRFAATNEMKIHYLSIGPTEVRIIFIIINALIIIFGKTYMVKALPFVLIFSFLGLTIVVYRTHLKLWQRDMKEKVIRDEWNRLNKK